MYSEKKLRRMQMPIIFLLILLVGSFNIYLAMTETRYFEVVPDLFWHNMTLNGEEQTIIVGYTPRTNYTLITPAQYQDYIDPIKKKYRPINYILGVGLLLYLILVFPRIKTNVKQLLRK